MIDLVKEVAGRYRVYRNEEIIGVVSRALYISKCWRAVAPNGRIVKACPTRGEALNELLWDHERLTKLRLEYDRTAYPSPG